MKQAPTIRNDIRSACSRRSGWVEMHSPKNSGSRCDFDEAVESETDQRNTSGNRARNDGDNSFEAIPNDGEILKALTSANKRKSLFGTENQRSSHFTS
jgi:hypothetical protein